MIVEDVDFVELVMRGFIDWQVIFVGLLGKRSCCWYRRRNRLLRQDQLVAVSSSLSLVCRLLCVWFARGSVAQWESIRSLFMVYCRNVQISASQHFVVVTEALACSTLRKQNEWVHT